MAAAQLICPTGCLKNSLSGPQVIEGAAQGNINFGISEISLDGQVETGILLFDPVPKEGRFAIVTDVGRGMRWTLIVPLTNGTKADGKVVWS
jgi:hypothetical protein